jgi:putative transcriptional regulator
MSSLFDEIASGLREAIAHAKGEKNGLVIHKISLPDLDVGAVRKKTDLSQEDFARTFGVSLGTLRNWEQRRVRPDGPARVLLTLIDRDPVAVLKTLRGAPAKRPARAARRSLSGARRTG